jgi:Cu/Ag efflux pump CusA
VFGLSADSSFRAPMAIAVIGGLITSTLLSLIVIPAAYTVIDDLADLLRRRRQPASAEAALASR